MVELSKEEWLEKGEELYGKDMEKKCSICGNEANIVYVDSNGKNYCKSCKATYICSGCGKPYEVEGIDNFICNKCGFSTG